MKTELWLVRCPDESNEWEVWYTKEEADGRVDYFHAMYDGLAGPGSTASVQLIHVHDNIGEESRP